MKTLEQLKNDHQVIADLENQLKENLNEFAIANCGTSIGAVVEIDGYSHRGKKMIVNKIVGSVYRSFNGLKIEAQIFGTVLKKDGSESLVKTKFDIDLG